MGAAYEMESITLKAPMQSTLKEDLRTTEGNNETSFPLDIGSET